MKFQLKFLGWCFWILSAASTAHLAAFGVSPLMAYLTAMLAAFGGMAFLLEEEVHKQVEDNNAEEPSRD